MQDVVLRAMRPIILHLGHYSTIAVLSGERRLYHISGREYYWPSMSTNMPERVQHSQYCLRVGMN